MDTVLPDSTALAAAQPLKPVVPPAALPKPFPAPAEQADKGHSGFEIGMLSAAELSLLADAMQTWNIKNHRNQQESNPILGHHPSDLGVLGYFGAVGAGTALGWHYLPKPWRTLLPLAVLAAEVPQIHRNMQAGISFSLPSF